MSTTELADLVGLVARLRGADGCPWDRRQTLVDLRAYLLEEAHELAAAIDTGDWGPIREELGDLCFQVAFVVRLAEEEGAFRLGDALEGIQSKMVARHPHVFGPVSLATAEDVQQAWERGKAARREAGSHLDGVPTSLPALVAAYRLGQKASGVGFDWSEPGPVLAKVREELAEVERASGDPVASREELGDLLFAIASYCRHLGIDPEGALAAANTKFRSRFAAMEQRLAEDGRRIEELDASALDQLWEQVKSDRRPSSSPARVQSE